MAIDYKLTLTGWVGSEWFDPDYVDYILQQYADEHVDVLIESLGGDAASAIRIAGAFRRHGDVAVHFAGMCASAATVAAMGAASVTIEPTALVMVHKCRVDVMTLEMMNSDEMEEYMEEIRKKQDFCDKVDSVIASLYALKSGKPSDEIMAMMQREQWCTAQETVDLGLADSISDDGAEGRCKRVTDAMLSDLVAAGLPVPPGMDARRSLVDRIVDAMAKIFAPKDPKNIIMDTTAKTSAPEPDELGKTQQSLQQANEQIAQLSATIAELREELDALKKAPAASTATVKTTGAAQATPGARSVIEIAADARKTFAAIRG